MFPTEESAVRWFEATFWSSGRACGHCGSTGSKEVPNQKPMPYWCPDCRSYFSVRTGTVLENSRLPLRKWVFAVYLYVTNLKSVSSMKLHRDLNVTQKTAWFMLHRLREAWDSADMEPFTGPCEMDETFVGGKVRNMSNQNRAKFKGAGALGKIPVVAVKDRPTNRVCASVVEDTTRITLQTFLFENIVEGAKVYTDEAAAYDWVPNREKVRHSAGEYVRQQAHTNGVESFWSMLKRAYKGTFHQLSAKHLNRYVQEFAGRHNVRPFDTLDQMQQLAGGLLGKRLRYRDLVA